MSQHLPRQQGANGVRPRLIVGLGNPGGQYERTRHNAGFWFVDELARQLRGDWRHEGRYTAAVCRARWPDSGEDVWLMKPQTFMNRSAQAVQPFMSFYRVDVSEILVAHDELDIPSGTVKMKLGGGTGGHNGLEDISQRLGTRDFWRLRLGIGHPGHKDLVTGFVLGCAPHEEQARLTRMIEESLGLIPYLDAGRIQDGLTWIHTHFAPPKPPKPPRAPRSAPETTATATATQPQATRTLVAASPTKNPLPE
jgi:peptidyl-tRNA hydrolase, PTH1 family